MSILLRTERMVLRRLTGADADHLYDLDSDPEVMRYLTGGRPTPYQVVAREILPALLAEYDHHGGLGRWAATHRDTGDFLGWFALRPHPRGPADEAELGYRLRREAWGRGYATEGARALVRAAFTTFGLRRVYAQTMAVNLASRRVMEKAGLRLERVFHLTFDDPIPGTEHGEVEYAVERGTDERDLVRHGYNALSHHYRRDGDHDGPVLPLAGRTARTAAGRGAGARPRRRCPDRHSRRPGGPLAPFWHVFQLPPEIAEAFAAVHRRVAPDSPVLQAMGQQAVETYRALFTRAADGIPRARGFSEPRQWRFDNCSITARLGARKWGPRFQAACEQIAFPTFDGPSGPDGRLVDAFRKNPMHEALASLAPLRPPVDISI